MIENIKIIKQKACIALNSLRSFLNAKLETLQNPPTSYFRITVITHIREQLNKYLSKSLRNRKKTTVLSAGIAIAMLFSPSTNSEAMLINPLIVHADNLEVESDIVLKGVEDQIDHYVKGKEIEKEEKEELEEKTKEIAKKNSESQHLGFEAVLVQSEIKDVETLIAGIGIDEQEVETISGLVEDSTEDNVEDRIVEEEQVEGSLPVYTNEDIEILERIVEAECTGGDIDSKKNVASVIINRTKDSNFPNTIEEVVFQKRQFSPITDGRYWSVSVADETKEAVEDVIASGVTNKAIYFANISIVKSKKNKDWFGTLEYLFTDSIGHSFYR